MGVCMQCMYMYMLPWYLLLILRCSWCGAGFGLLGRMWCDPGTVVAAFYFVVVVVHVLDSVSVLVLNHICTF